MNDHCKPFIGEPMRISIKNQWKPTILLHKAAMAAAWRPIRFENDTANAYYSVRPEMVDFGSGQGRSDLETAAVARRRLRFPKSDNAGRDRKMPFMDDAVATADEKG